MARYLGRYAGPAAVVAVALLVALLVTGAVVVVAGGGSRVASVAVSGEPAVSATASPGLGAGDLPLAAAADGGEVRLVESGFTPVRERTSHRVSWGLIVENTSQQTAATLAVDVDIMDSDGDSLLGDDDPKRHWLVVLPGQRAGVVGFPYVDGPGAAELAVTVEPREWWPPENPVQPVRPVTVSEVVPSRGDAGWSRGDPLAVRFRVDSGYELMLTGAYANLLLRNEAGEIVGGLREHMGNRIPPGWSFQQVRFHDDAATLTVDMSRSEVYLTGWREDR